MFTIGRRVWVLLMAGVLMLSLCACGSNPAGNKENTQETETEKEVEIADATDILTKVWNEYEAVDTDGNMYNDRFDVMGGHFESAVMNMPAKYDLTKTSDLELMYCVPETVIPMIDDAGTIVHLMKASTFTAGAYHVTDVANVKTVVEGIKTQTLENQWLGGFPDKHLIAIVDGQYVVSAVGTEEVVDNFEDMLEEVFGKQVSIQVKEDIR
ncbi:MAG: hypothetical protein J6I97_02360 [Agathobacter sp.]|nr:hypothetical protein [Agathobacter sp.]